MRQEHEWITMALPPAHAKSAMCAFPKHSVFSLTIMQGGFLFYMLGAGQYIRVKDANTSLNQNHSNKSDWPSLAKGP